MRTETIPVETTWSSIAWHRAMAALLILFILLSVPDLFSPPITPTGLRQVQTYAQTVNFVAAGFSLNGLTLDIDGPKPFHVVYEFPLYQSLAGMFFLAFGQSFFWGKIISLVAAVVGFGIALQLARKRWGEALTWRAGLFFASSPIALLVSASFQPDALALAFTAAAGWFLARWRFQPSLNRWCIFIVWMLIAALTKFTVLVPFLPLFVLLVLHREGQWRFLQVSEIAVTLLLFLIPFFAWNFHRGTLMDPRYLATDRNLFFIGDLTRFFRPEYYVKSVFILGAMVLCGAGLPLALLGLRRLEKTTLALVCGIPVYFVLLPTAATQTYYAWPLVPVLALLAGRGTLQIESATSPNLRRLAQTLIVIFWIVGFSVAAPYTLRHDTISRAAANAAHEVSDKNDLLFVLNMHDRGVAIGGLNPTIITLAERKGWNVDFESTDLTVLRTQIEKRRREGAKWLITTWYTPDLEPWFTPLLPAAFGRQPRFGGQLVDGRTIVGRLSENYSIAADGPNFAVLRLP